MEILFYILKLCAGIGLFLFAMYLLEDSLKNLSGRNFKIFLKRVSKNSVGAVSGGAVVTAVLQSSSVVSLMVLAFVGAGVFTMKNALAIILGANLGTTISGWLVVTLGFKVNIEIIAYPAVCIGGLLLILFNDRKNLKYISNLLLGFGLMFIGLAFMKTAMENQVKDFDFSKYKDMSLAVFLLIGFLITVIIQSSSVTMALTLSALFAGAIDFIPATAIVLGSETGTTIKIMLGAIGGTAAKKRIVTGNFLYNIVLTIIAFMFLKQTVFLITDIFKIKDPLIGLVTFSSMLNLFGIFVFIPFLNPFSKFLERLFKESDGSASVFIKDANVKESRSALELFQKESEYFLYSSLLYNLSMFEADTKCIKLPDDLKTIITERKFQSQSFEKNYEFLKQLQGEMQAFYVELNPELHQKEASQLNQMISSVRSSMHAVKSMKDIRTNISNLSRSSKDVKFDFFMEYKRTIEHLYCQLGKLLNEPTKENQKEFQHIYGEILNHYTTSLNNFYKEVYSDPIDDMDLTTVINFNREIFTSNKAILIAIKDFLMSEKEANEFNKILVYKT